MICLNKNHIHIEDLSPCEQSLSIYHGVRVTVCDCVWFWVSVLRLEIYPEHKGDHLYAQGMWRKKAKEDDDLIYYNSSHSWCIPSYIIIGCEMRLPHSRWRPTFVYRCKLSMSINLGKRYYGSYCMLRMVTKSMDR